MFEFMSEGDEEELQIEVSFIDENGRMRSSSEIYNHIEQVIAKNNTQDKRLDKPSSQLEEAVKSITGSNQSDEEVRRNSVFVTQPIEIEGESRLVEPPYDVNVMQDFLDIEETHARCVRAKATDSVGRGYQLKNSAPISLESGVDKVDGSSGLNAEETIERETYLNELRLVKKLIRDCNEIVGFEGVLELAALDYEGIGWGAIEVIRGLDKKVKKLAHVSAKKIKPIVGWKGFIEDRETSTGRTERYYLPFGKKLRVRVENKVVGSYYEDFDPDIHSIEDAEFNLVSSIDGKPTDNFDESANEIIWIKNNHPNTIYYGYSDIIPAVGALIGNSNIRQYFLQFFQHNTVPRYAVIIEGGRVTEEVKKFIHDYFNSEVKRSQHTTLILNVPSMRGEVKVKFEALDTAQKEGDFLKTLESNQSAIRISHGVPGAILGVTDAPEMGSGKGLSQAEIYKDRVVIPRQKKWQNAINGIFRLGLGVKYVVLEFNPLDIKDREAEMRILTGYMDRGVIEINDVRENTGRQPIKGGNRAFVKSRSGSLVFVDGFDSAGPVHPAEEKTDNGGQENTPQNDNNSQENDSE